MPTWKHYAELRPDELESLVSHAPVAFWPLGLLEHHGWHLPIGFDGIKAERLCQRLAARTGGVILPIMWWGGIGGHGPFHWTHYQDPEAAAKVLATTVGQLIHFGFRALVLMAGHYPWQSLLDAQLPPIQQAHPEVLLLWGTEASIAREAVQLGGDHAAREETSYGLALLPELVDLAALTPGRDQRAWPQGQPPPLEGRHPGVCFDTADPRFAQYGEDARLGSAQRVENGLDLLVDHLAGRIASHLSPPDPRN